MWAFGEDRDIGFNLAPQERRKENNGFKPAFRPESDRGEARREDGQGGEGGRVVGADPSTAVGLVMDVGRCSANPGRTPLQRPANFLDVVTLDDVADPHVLVVLEGHAALLARLDLTDLVLEAFERR
jgi:hypothetical protein